MVFAIILEPKFFDVMSKVENSFWSGDEARQQIVTKSKIFLKINFVFLSTWLILSLVMFPLFGDHK
jgi:hypothetical protein